jgi:subtilase family serine protease
VGGTDLVTASAAGPWKSETAWTDSGGGISPDSIPIPSWQQLSGVITSTNKGSTTLRNGPDVSANANFTFYTCADQTTCLANEYGGTSFAAPMWAAYIALANEQSVNNGGSTLGFIDPTIYPQNLTSAYATDFHDITSGTSGSYSATTGYDLVTGWGSPNGTGLINALATTSSSPTFSLSATSVSILQGSSGSSTVTSSVADGFDSAVALTVSGLPTGVTGTFNPTSITGSGSSTLSLTVASTTTAGTYTITVTGTSPTITQTTTFTLTVTSPVSGGFSISVSPTAGSLDQGQSGYAVVTVTATGGFDSAVTLTSSGEPSGVTGTYSPTSITGSGTSDFTLKVARTAKTGTYPITITGTSGTTTHSTTLTFTVDR